jgi:hypothetical protein
MTNNKPPLGNNRWHHGNGVLVCGTIRIASADFDTNPSEEFKNEMFTWICETLNKASEEVNYSNDYVDTSDWNN